MNFFNYPSEYFAYLFIFLVTGGAFMIFTRTFRDGYWGKESEDVKYRMLEDDVDQHPKSKENQ